MTKYEEIMKSMTPETMAQLNVRLVTINNSSLVYLTSSGQLFLQEEYDKANLYFDKISLNNSINDFNDGLNTIVDIDLFYIYKKIFDEIKNI